MMKICYTILLVLIYPFYSVSQQCGTYVSDECTHKLIENKKDAIFSNYNRSVIDNYIPLQFHIVRNDDGFGGINESKILDAVCKLNEEFAPLNMAFFIANKFNYLNDDLVHEQNNNNTAINNIVVSYFLANKVESAVNIFVGSTLSSGNSGYYSRNADVIYMDKFYVNTKDIILSHELGHYFSLRHTFSGWEDTLYDPSLPTPKSVYLDNTEYKVEYVDRAINCDEAGDLICDTPADYITVWSGPCNYSGGGVDPDGVLIDPEEKNIMSYFSFNNCNEYIFSADQVSIIMADYNSRTDLIENQDSNVDTVMASAELLSPQNEETVSSQNIELLWSKVDNASFYKVEISKLKSFSVISNTFFTDEESINIDELQKNKSYYWRVSAYNQVEFCEQLNSDIYKFKTSETVSVGNTSTGRIKIYPNPVSGDNIWIKGLETGEAFSFSVFNVTGKTFLSSDSTTGNSIKTTNLPLGVYFIKFQQGNNIFTYKFLKQ